MTMNYAFLLHKYHTQIIQNTTNVALVMAQQDRQQGARFIDMDQIWSRQG